MVVSTPSTSTPSSTSGFGNEWAKSGRYARGLNSKKETSILFAHTKSMTALACIHGEITTCSQWHQLNWKPYKVCNVSAVAELHKICLSCQCRQESRACFACINPVIWPFRHMEQSMWHWVAPLPSTTVPAQHAGKCHVYYSRPISFNYSTDCCSLSKWLISVVKSFYCSIRVVYNQLLFTLSWGDLPVFNMKASNLANVMPNFSNSSSICLRDKTRVQQ